MAKAYNNKLDKEAVQYVAEISTAVSDLAKKILNSGSVNPETFSETDALRIATFLVAQRRLSAADKQEIKNIECFV